LASCCVGLAVVSSAAFWSSVRELVSAPSSARALIASVWPPKLAYTMADQPSCDARGGRHMPTVSEGTQQQRRLRHACVGRQRTLFVALMSAPSSARALTASVWPPSLADMMADLPLCDAWGGRHADGG
jgi:hypothetical protein